MTTSNRNAPRSIASDLVRLGWPVLIAQLAVMANGLIEKLGSDKMAQSAPMRRLGDDEDLKGLTLLFASDAGKHITGQWLAVDGGVSALIGG